MTLIAKLYVMKRKIKDFDAPARHLARQQRSQPVADELHQWLTGQRARLVDAHATAKAIDYSIKRWTALTRYLDERRCGV